MLYFKLFGAIFLFLFFGGKLAQSSHWQSKPHLPVYLPTSSQDLKSNPDSSSIRKKKKKKAGRQQTKLFSVAYKERLALKKKWGGGKCFQEWGKGGALKGWAGGATSDL